MGLFGNARTMNAHGTLNSVPHPGRISFLAASLCTGLCALLALAGCDASGTKASVSSGTFFAPVPLAVDQVTGTNDAGERRVEVLVDRIDMLRLISPEKLTSQLELEDAESVVLGRTSETSYVLFERNSGTVFEYDVSTRHLDLSIDRIALARTFNTTKAQFSSVSNLQDGEWIFGFETSERSLFVMRRVPKVGGQMELQVDVLANINSIRQQIRKQKVNFIMSEEVGRRSFRNDAGELVRVSEVLLIASPPGGAGGLEGIQDVHLFVIKEVNGVISGEFRVFDENGTPYFGFTDGDPIDPRPIIPDNGRIPLFDEFLNPIPFFGLVNYDTIRRLTGNADVDIFDFRPATVRDPANPGETLPEPRFFVLYEKTAALFLLVELVRETDPASPDAGEVIGSRVSLFSAPGEVDSAVRQGGSVLPGAAAATEFKGAFYHPTEPLLLTFEEQSNTMMELDYSELRPDTTTTAAQETFGARVGVFSPNSNLVNRRDHQGPFDADITPAEPDFVISEADVSQNRLIFDQGTDDVLSMNYETGIYVVVIKQRDVGSATGSPGVSDLTFIKPISQNEILVMDTQASDLLEIRIDYAAFPINIRTTRVR